MIEFTKDAEGYPSEETLQRIRDYKVMSHADAKVLLDSIEPIWEFGEWGWRWIGNELHLSTGGWSGNESIISALEAADFFWPLCWVQHRRGGHYIFEIKV
jgi:hypothetical protein